MHIFYLFFFAHIKRKTNYSFSIQFYLSFLPSNNMSNPSQWTPAAEKQKNWSIQGGGGHQRGHGTDVTMHGHKQVWQSDNKRHEINAHASVSQHFGGPHGNHRSGAGGASYSYRFGGK